MKRREALYKKSFRCSNNNSQAFLRCWFGFEFSLHEFTFFSLNVIVFVLWYSVCPLFLCRSKVFFFQFKLSLYTIFFFSSLVVKLRIFFFYFSILVCYFLIDIVFLIASVLIPSFFVNKCFNMCLKGLFLYSLKIINRRAFSILYWTVIFFILSH